MVWDVLGYPGNPGILSIPGVATPTAIGIPAILGSILWSFFYGMGHSGMLHLPLWQILEYPSILAFWDLHVDS